MRCRDFTPSSDARPQRRSDEGWSVVGHLEAVERGREGGGVVGSQSEAGRVLRVHLNAGGMSAVEAAVLTAVKF
jgi:hypothetical protein